MKNITILFILVATLFANIAMGQGDTTYTKISTEINNVVDNISAKISGLATELKVPAEQVYQTLVLQQRVQSVTWVFLLAISLIITVILKKNIHVMKRHYPNETEQVLWIIVTIITGLTLIALLMTIIEFVTGVFNPEYGALREIINFLQ